MLRGLLREAEEEVCEIVAGIGQGLGAACCVLRSGEAGENKIAFGISGGTEVLEYAAIVAAKAPVMLSAIPGKVSETV